jgi:hypothetical protein
MIPRILSSEPMKVLMAPAVIPAGVLQESVIIVLLSFPLMLPASLLVNMDTSAKPVPNLCPPVLVVVVSQMRVPLLTSVPQVRYVNPAKTQNTFFAPHAILTIRRWTPSRMIRSCSLGFPDYGKHTRQEDPLEIILVFLASSLLELRIRSTVYSPVSGAGNTVTT